MKKENNSQESIYNNKGDSTLLRVLRFILPYCIYTKLPLSLKDSATPHSLTPKGTIKENWWLKMRCKYNIFTYPPLPNFYIFRANAFWDAVKKDNPGKEIVIIDVENFDNLPPQPENENIVIGYRMAYKG